jgi:hypothetical protein
MTQRHQERGVIRYIKEKNMDIGGRVGGRSSKGE